MRLTRQTSYAIRTLMYCAVNNPGLSRVADIAKAHGISELFLFKLIKPLVEHGLTIHRLFHPGTMRGVVSGHLSGTGPDIYTGELHGVITPEGMRGVVVMTRHREDGATDTFVGRWSASGHPTNPFGPPFFDPGYVVNFEGRFILSP